MSHYKHQARHSEQAQGAQRLKRVEESPRSLNLVEFTPFLRHLYGHGVPFMVK
jgi:hypothetical protein